MMSDTLVVGRKMSCSSEYRCMFIDEMVSYIGIIHIYGHRYINVHSVKIMVVNCLVIIG